MPDDTQPTIQILLVDDDPDDCLLIESVIRMCRLNAEITTVNGFDDGVAAYRSGGFDICVLDYALGARTGIEFLDTLAAKNELATPVIVLTGAEDEELDVQVLRSGATDYLAKATLAPAVLKRSIRYAVERAVSQARFADLERRLEQSQRLEALGRLSGGIAHEINNVLTVILANTELIRSGAEGEEDCLTDIRNVGTRGAALVRKLLSYSRRDSIHMEPISLFGVARGSVDTIRRIVPASIDVSFGGNDGDTVLGDTRAIEQVLLNLAANATDAMPSGGSINITVNRRVADPSFCVEHQGTRPGEYAEVTVTDTGTGMSAETQLRMFEPFFSTKSFDAATGLGMSMVWGLMKQHGGFVYVTSAIGEGTRVQLLFPTTTLTPKVPLQSAQGALADNRKGRILLVEDELELRRVTRRVLERAGYTVIAASDGRRGLELYHEVENEIDLILSDIVMPKLGGVEMWEEIRRMGGRPRVLFTSGYSGDAALETVPGNVLRKPWTMEELLNSVRTALEQDAPERSLETDSSTNRFRRLTAGESLQTDSVN